LAYCSRYEEFNKIIYTFMRVLSVKNNVPQAFHIFESGVLPSPKEKWGY